MRPEVRVKLLKEYETTKTKLEHGSILLNIVSMIFCATFFVRSIIGVAKDPENQNTWAFIVLIISLLLGTIWQSFIIVRKFYDKKILLLLQAVLDLSEEKIYKEINDLDIQEKEDNVIREN